MLTAPARNPAKKSVIPKAFPSWKPPSKRKVQGLMSEGNELDIRQDMKQGKRKAMPKVTVTARSRVIKTDTPTV